MTFCLDQAIADYFLQVHCQYQGPSKKQIIISRYTCSICISFSLNDTIYLVKYQVQMYSKINVVTVQIRLDPVHPYTA